MKTIKVKNTKHIKLAGIPSDNIIPLDNPKTIAVCPALAPYTKPRLLVKIGDSVKIGTKLYFDKQDENVTFTSPASGEIEDIIYGKKRIIKNIIIKCDGKNESESFSKIDINSATRDSIKKSIIENSLWNSFRIFPFLDIPKTDDLLPNDVYISIDDDEPHHPSSISYIKPNIDSFLNGLNIIKKLFNNVHISTSSNNKEIQDILKNEITHIIKGHYPANNSGVFLYYDKKDISQNKSCTIKPQDIIKIGSLLHDGKYFNKRLITLAGSILEKPTHLLVNDGTKISDILSNEKLTGDYRIIAGGVFKGRATDIDDYLGQDEYAIHILSNELKQDLISFMKIGFNKHTLSRAYASFFLPKKEIKADTSLYGEPRACISCSLCVDVCPVELLPQEIMKNLYDNRRKESLELGMLDCVDCGMCTYACPANIEVADIIKVAKNKLHKELN
jgi:Na+-transporting NADH:ubiquinone oxidoreductase subunit A